MNQPHGNVVLLHGRWPERIDGTLIADIPSCNPNSEENWMGWTKKQLEEKGYSVTCPIIADVWKATYKEWKTELDTFVVDEETTLVGLSAGAFALVRWLGESGKKVKKLILVAPASKKLLDDVNGDRMPAEKEFYSYEIPPQLKSQISEQVVIIVSKDDYEGILRSVELLKEALDARVVQLDGLGHFSFLIPQLPELLEEILVS